LLLVGISEYSNYNTFQEATSFPHSLFCWKKKLQTQVLLHRIRDEEHHQSKKKKKIHKNSLTLCSETQKLCERKICREEREREREREQGDGVTQQSNKQAKKVRICRIFAHKFCREEGKKGKKKRKG
jgi:hypothetical protein